MWTWRVWIVLGVVWIAIVAVVIDLLGYAFPPSSDVPVVPVVSAVLIVVTGLMAKAISVRGRRSRAGARAGNR